jgi:two-component system, NarL family, nitrate/nitrite response regulator NarL
MEPVAIEGLRSLLQSADGLRLVASETTLEDGLDAVRELGPQLAVVDKAFGPHGVMDFLTSVPHAPNETRVIVWGTAFSELEALRLMQAGAAAVVRKTSSLDMLIECIRSVASGARWMEGDIIRESDAMERRRSPALTARELEVLRLVERGMRNREIGDYLGICVGTVKIHLKHIFEKRGIRGRYGLALSGLREKGVQTPIPV